MINSIIQNNNNMRKFLENINWLETLIIYLILLFIFRYITFFPVLKLTDEKPLNFIPFIIYNYSFNSLLIVLKWVLFSFICVVGSMILSQKTSFKKIIKSIILAHYIYFVRYLSLFAFAFFTKKKFVFYDLVDHSQLKLHYLLNIESNLIIESILKSISLYDIAFVLTTAYLFSIQHEIKLKQGLVVIISSLTPIYIIYPLILAFLKTI